MYVINLLVFLFRSEINLFDWGWVGDATEIIVTQGLISSQGSKARGMIYKMLNLSQQYYHHFLLNNYIKPFTKINSFLNRHGICSEDVSQIAIAHTQPIKLLLFCHVSLKALQSLKGVKLYTFWFYSRKFAF